MLDLQGLRLRAAFFSSIRSFFVQKSFLEVDTPTRQPIIIPEANIVPISAGDNFLQSSPELCMKRLLAAGAENIFQICNCFRKGEIGRLHLEEFQMLEWYRTGEDYLQLMDDCENLLRFVQSNLRTNGFRPLRGDFLENVDLSGDWTRLSVEEAFSKYSPLSVNQALEKEVFDETLVEYIEPNLGQKRPLFLYDYPVELGSLARPKPGNPHLAERFELYIKGVELANGFSELTDEAEQRKRFSEEIKKIQTTDNYTAKMPGRFLEDIKKLSNAGGIALGLDRLFMLLNNESELRFVTTFAPEDFIE